MVIFHSYVSLPEGISYSYILMLLRNRWLQLQAHDANDLKWSETGSESPATWVG